MAPPTTATISMQCNEVEATNNSNLMKRSHYVTADQVDMIGSEVSVSQADISAAVNRISKHAHKTPVHTSRLMNDWLSGSDSNTNSKTSSPVNHYFKLECFQRTGSFKFRGATNAISKLLEEYHPTSPTEKLQVKTHSSGNHGQAVAHAANLLGVNATVVVPEGAAQCKVSAIEGYGAKIVRCAQTTVARDEVTATLPGRLVHPYLEPAVVAGQATVGVEIAEQVPHADCVVVPIGGGGLISGITLAVRARLSGIRVIGAEPELACGAAQSLRDDKRIEGKSVQSMGVTIADGVGSSIGVLGWHVLKHLVDDVVTVSEEEIVTAMKQVYGTMKVVIEPSAAVGIAACKTKKFKQMGFKDIAVVVCGGNVDLDQLPWIKRH